MLSLKGQAISQIFDMKKSREEPKRTLREGKNPTRGYNCEIIITSSKYCEIKPLQNLQVLSPNLTIKREFNLIKNARFCKRDKLQATFLPNRGL